jgi:hypothetical protein
MISLNQSLALSQEITVASIKRQITESEKQQVLTQQRRNGALYCFVDDHRIENEDDVEFHHIKPFSDDGPSEIANIGAVCKEHHRRIRTLSLSEFRDQLAMGRFFDHPDQRRLDDLLTLKLSASGFGRKAIIEDRQSQILLHFTAPERSPQTCTVFSCPATGIRYFNSVLPIEYVCNDEELQPRPLEQKRVGELYRHLTAHTQLAPAICRLVESRIMLFDGQHKLFTHKIWDDPNPEVVSQLKINAVEQVRSFLSAQGLTVNWVLGGTGA